MRTFPDTLNYPTDLNDAEWAVVEKFLDGPSKLG